MLGDPGIGTYLMYAGIVLLLLLFIVMFLRLAFMLSLLFLSPIATVLRRFRGLGATGDNESDRPSS